MGWLFVNLGWLWLGLFWLISGHIFFDPTFLNSHHPFSWNINETNSCWDHLRPLPFQSPRRPISSSSKIRKTNQYKATMKRTSEDIITARNPGEILAIDLNNIAIDTRGSSSSISTLAGLTQQRRQVGNSGRSGGGDIGRVVRSAKVWCTKVVEIINNLEQECMGSVSLLINQHVLLFDSDEKNFNFSQTALN